MKKNRKIWIAILGLFCLDRLTKYCFFDLQRWKSSLLLEPVFNTGISRGISMNLPIVIVVSLIGMGIFTRLWKTKTIKNLTFIFLLAGTLGNFIDRIVFDGVRDFISIGRFPVFNLADCFLTIAVILWIRGEICSCNSSQKK